MPISSLGRRLIKTSWLYFAVYKTLRKLLFSKVTFSMLVVNPFMMFIVSDFERTCFISVPDWQDANSVIKAIANVTFCNVFIILIFHDVKKRLLMTDIHD